MQHVHTIHGLICGQLGIICMYMYIRVTLCVHVYVHVHVHIWDYACKLHVVGCLIPSLLMQYAK